ncbi:hypothetical protein BJM06_a00069 (plasmid) [Enterobacter cloacae]|nr:hypothetical protein BJM06_a00069 [Enterobacter cloacae]
MKTSIINGSEVSRLSVAIHEEVKDGNTLKNITWDELDNALINNPKLFSSLDPVEK